MSGAITAERLAEALARLPGWRVEAGTLRRSYRFPSFGEAVRFMHACIEAIDQADHHPEWSNTYNRVEVRLSTHDEGGIITAKDVALAKILEWQAGLWGVIG